MLTKLKTRSAVNRKTATRLVKYAISVVFGMLFGLAIHFGFYPNGNIWASAMVFAVLSLMVHMVFGVLKAFSPSNIKAVKAEIREETLDAKIAKLTKLEDELAVLFTDIQKDKEFKAKKEAEKKAILNRVGTNVLNKKMDEVHNG